MPSTTCAGNCPAARRRSRPGRHRKGGHEPAERHVHSAAGAAARPLLGAPAVRFIAYLGLCAAYLQGGIVKLTDFPGALGEMAQFWLAPAPLFAMWVIALEPGGSLMILFGWLRWLGAQGVAGFTLLVTDIALRYWRLPPGHERFMAANAFFEHLGLAGGRLPVLSSDSGSVSISGQIFPGSNSKTPCGILSDFA